MEKGKVHAYLKQKLKERLFTPSKTYTQKPMPQIWCLLKR